MVSLLYWQQPGAGAVRSCAHPRSAAIAEPGGRSRETDGRPAPVGATWWHLAPTKVHISTLPGLPTDGRCPEHSRAWLSPAPRAPRTRPGPAPLTQRGHARVACFALARHRLARSSSRPLAFF
jgi:hypothetical protein